MDGLYDLRQRIGEHNTASKSKNRKRVYRKQARGCYCNAGHRGFNYGVVVRRSYHRAVRCAWRSEVLCVGHVNELSKHQINKGKGGGGAGSYLYF